MLKRAPGRALAAVLCDTGHKIGVRAMWDERIETARTQGIEPLADGVLERWFPQSFREGEPEQLAGWRAMLTRTTGTGYAGTSAAIRDTDFTDFVGTISVPVLCITGSHDLATPPDLGRDLASRIPASQFALVEGAGHLPMIDHPDQLIALIREFLTRNVGPRP